MIEGQEGVSWQDWQAIAEACERHGIPALYRSDHYLPLEGNEHRQVLDAWGTIIALAAATSTLRLGTLVSPATFRHPSVLAKLVVTADHVSGGRVELGLGAGWHDREHAAYGFPFADLRTRMEVFTEQLEIVRGLWADEPFTFQGRHYALDHVDSQPKPLQRPHPPLIVGGFGGRRSAALAARWADEYNTPFPTLDEVRERRAIAAEAWEQAGRGADTLRFTVMTGLLVGRDEDDLRDRSRRLAEKRGTDEVPASFVTGTVEQAAARLREMRDAGVDRVMLQLLLHDDLEQIRLIGEELAPAVA